MRIWFSRLLATIFVLSLVATPQAMILAADDTPEVVVQGLSEGEIETHSGDADGVDVDPVGSDSSSDADNTGPENSNPDGGTDEDVDSGGQPGNDTASEDEATPTGEENKTVDDLDPEADSTETDAHEEGEDGVASTQSSAAPLNFSDKIVPLPTYDASTGTLIFEFTLESGFSAGRLQPFYVWYDSDTLIVDESSLPIAVPEIDGLVVWHDSGWDEFVFTFEEWVDPLEESVTVSVSVGAQVIFDVCRPSTEPYQAITHVYFNTPTTSGSIQVEGPECPASTDPVITDVGYYDRHGSLELDIYFVDAPVLGQQLTLTYEQDKLFVEPGPYEVVAAAMETGELFIIGTATASNGLITIDFVDANIPGELESEFVASVEMTGWLQGDTCSTSDAPSHFPGGSLVFVSGSGTEFYERYGTFICNLEGPSVAGEWGTDDLGNPVIHWTIDSGDLHGFTEFDVYPFTADELVFDCDSRNITTVYGDFTVSANRCGLDYFWYDFDPVSDEPFRAIVEVTTSLHPDYDYLSVASCVSVAVYDIGVNQPQLQSTQASNGSGGYACHEMFLEQGRDVLTKTVDKPEALPGETLTYTVEATTSTDMWTVIDVSDTLPVGFTIDPDSITCAVEPAIYQLEPCFVLSDSTLRVQVRVIAPDEDVSSQPHSDPVSIRVTYQGEVTGEPGSTLVSQACSVRSFTPYLGGEGAGNGQFALQQVEGDQNVIGGGRICMEASTLILQPDVDDGDGDVEDPGGEDPDNGGEDVTPGTKPSAPVEVKELPATGTNGGNTSSLGMLAATIAASMLIATSVGIRLLKPARA